MTFEPQALGEILHWAGKQGWGMQLTHHKDDYRVKAWRRKGEHLYLIWRARLFAPAESWFTSPDHTYQQVGSAIEGRLPVPDAAAAVSVLRTFEPTFDFTDWPDEAVLKYLQGKEITWVNAMTGQEDKATVPGSEFKSTRIGCSRMGRRHVTFALTAYQSVGLDAITEIR